MNGLKLSVVVVLGTFSFWVPGCLLSEDDEPSSPVTVMCLAEQDLPGWSLWGHACHTLRPADLRGDGDPSSGGINGGADFYTDKGMKTYVYQELGTAAKSITAYAMDFENAENARAMYADTRNEASARLQVPGYDTSSAVLGMFGGGAAYELRACLGRYFFWMTYEGLADTGEAKALAKQSLDLYRGKTP